MGGFLNEVSGRFSRHDAVRVELKLAPFLFVNILFFFYWPE